MSYVTSSGYTGKTYAERRVELVAILRASHPTLAKVDFRADSPEGQIIDGCCRILTHLDESAQAAFGATDPASAADVTALAIARLRGTKPRAATRGTVPATLDLDAGSYAASSLVAYVDGEPDNRWALLNNISGHAGGEVVVTFQAEQPGSSYTAPAGELTQLIGVTGWNSITNASDASVGRDQDTPEGTLLRSEALFYRPQLNGYDGIRASMLEVPGVVDAIVEAGSGDCHPVVYDTSSEDASDTELADAIWNKVPPGIGTTGSTSATTETGGYGVSFDRASDWDLYVDVEVAGSGIDTDAVKAALQGALPGELLGVVKWGLLYAAVLGVPGVDSIVSLGLGSSASPTGEVNLTPTATQWPVLQTGNIGVTVS